MTLEVTTKRLSESELHKVLFRNEETIAYTYIESDMFKGKYYWKLVPKVGYEYIGSAMEQCNSLDELCYLVAWRIERFSATANENPEVIWEQCALTGNWVAHLPNERLLTIRRSKEGVYGEVYSYRLVACTLLPGLDTSRKFKDVDAAKAAAIFAWKCALATADILVKSVTYHVPADPPPGDGV